MLNTAPSDQQLRERALELALQNCNGNSYPIKELVKEAIEIVQFLKGEDANHLQAK